ncbi:glycine betaine ABC transporter substrate-binding protein [Chitinophaga pendula]|uniref:glycine betaine ABC transporter substrate-binding protein n=1 Tax=Chitinophaga TaxID=79328 RepID=UPI000BB09A7D|nr:MULTISPECIES: glycine betaine ABC transporter substrate-binding protein [Chitinophaga]ASZ13625.1 glycine/betaine ABC transporter [Chitinophaga sp. MD30]UCJ08750.1 glycine betaine ABC transporter substrate-binding protein [Chitinophaga pendula]
MQKRCLIGICLLAIITGLWACSNGAGGKKKVTIAYVNWAEGVAMTQLAKQVLEQRGYNVSLKNADVAPVFAAVAGRNADVFMDTWMPVTHKTYMDTFGDKLTVLGTCYEGAKIGFVVPDYVKANSIEDLKQQKAAFNGKIVGIDAGAGIMTKAEEAVKTYDLPYELQSSSEAAMMATLKKKIDAKETVVVTGWAPHWMFARYQLKFLTDDKKVFGEAEQIQVIANKQFVTLAPEAATFFSNFHLDEQQLASLMAAIAEADGQEDTAVGKWITDHQELVDKW